MVWRWRTACTNVHSRAVAATAPPRSVTANATAPRSYIAVAAVIGAAVVADTVVRQAANVRVVYTI